MIKLNNVEIDFKMFPNKEKKVLIDEYMISPSGNNKIIFKWEGDEDLISLMFVKRWIDGVLPRQTNELLIAYMPYSRMDRVEDECFTLKYVCEIINAMSFDFITVIEPHSDVTIALLNNATAFEMSKALFEEAISTCIVDFNVEDDFVCYPDATAHKRYSKMGDYNEVIGMKDRDFTTGWIKNLDLFIPGSKSLHGKNVIIIDDLCSKGGTFIMTAKELRARGAKSVTLVVAHCEESILEGEILNTDLIDKVFTTNTMTTHEQAGKHATSGKMYIANFVEYI